jgi:uncharacterized protein (TIGR03435 family)
VHVKAMMRTMLADRFQLVMRKETRETAVYALTVAAGGPKMVPGAIEEKDCPAGPATGAPTCHQFTGGVVRGLHAKAVDMEDLAGYLENFTDHPVVNRTGLSGLFGVDTEGWRPLNVPAEPPPGASAADLAMLDPARPTLFVVLRRLGLDLKQSRGPVDFYTVEKVERPAAN